MKIRLTRKEIAGLLQVSVKTVERQEEAWGLVKFRRVITRRQIDYDGARVVERLSELRLLP